jgi:hypothetical protein
LTPPTLSVALLAVATLGLTLTLVVTHHRGWKARLPLRVMAALLAAGLAWMAVDLTLRQKVATLDEIVQAGHEAHANLLVVNPGSVNTEDGPLRPRLKVRLPGGVELPLRVRAGSYAPLGVHVITAHVKAGRCILLDDTVECTYDKASTSLRIGYGQ